MSFQPLTNPVDYVLLANRRSPGIAVVTLGNSPRRWDERRGYALTGGRLVFRGIGFAHPLLTLKLYTDQDWADWHDWRPMLDRPPIGERAHALDIWHPQLEDLGIVSVVVEDVLQGKQTADGEWSIDIKLIEYRRPLPALSVAEGSVETPDDPIDRLIEDLTAQVDTLSNG